MDSALHGSEKREEGTTERECFWEWGKNVEQKHQEWRGGEDITVMGTRGPGGTGTDGHAWRLEVRCFQAITNGQL